MTEAATLTDIIADYQAQGWSGEFGVEDDPVVHCYSCDTTLQPNEVGVISSRHLEGPSDPADMATVYAVSCPACSQAGTMVLRYGPEASAAEADVTVALRDARVGDAGYATPTETSSPPPPPAAP